MTTEAISMLSKPFVQASRWRRAGLAAALSLLVALGTCGIVFLKSNEGSNASAESLRKATNGMNCKTILMTFFLARIPVSYPMTEIDLVGIC
jgi:hypothetical protein